MSRHDTSGACSYCFTGFGRYHEAGCPMNMKCSQCDRTDQSPGGLINMDAYLGGSGAVRGWVCPDHVPEDWMGKPGSRLNAHELFAIHAYVEKNKEVLSQQLKAPKIEAPE